MWARSRSFIEKWKMMLLNAVIKKYLSLSGIVHMAFFFVFLVYKEMHFYIHITNWSGLGLH